MIVLQRHTFKDRVQHCIHRIHDWRYRGLKLAARLAMTFRFTTVTKRNAFTTSPFTLIVQLKYRWWKSDQTLFTRSTSQHQETSIKSAIQFCALESRVCIIYSGYVHFVCSNWDKRWQNTYTINEQSSLTALTASCPEREKMKTN